jgi:hypothetical protein
MMSRTNTILLALVLSSGMAQAAFTDIAPTKDISTMWTQVSQSVKVKATEIWNYWAGSEPPTQQAATASAPAETPASAAPVASTPATPVEAAAPSASAAPATAGSARVSGQQPAQPQSPKAEVSQENAQLRGQKLFERPQSATSLKDMQAFKEALKSKPALVVAQPARAGTSKLPKSKAGVPVADIRQYRVAKKIPRLDIGSESTISAEDFSMPRLDFTVGKASAFKRLESAKPMAEAEFRKVAAMQIATATGAKGLQANIRTVGKPMDRAQVDAVKYVLGEASDHKPLPYKPLSEEELKMVAALILFEKGNQCHFVMGLFHQLAQAPKTKIEATYHLGACADSLKMDQVAFDKLAQVVTAQDKEFTPLALELLAKDLPVIYEVPFYQVVKGMKTTKDMVTEKSQDDVAYRMAKGAFRAKDYKTSLNYAGRVNRGTDFHDDAQFLLAMNSFALKDKKVAQKKLEELSESMQRSESKNKNLRALTAVNLARMYFSNHKYEKALEQYMQVPKDHALWVQALIEQGWTQLALEDFSGAIGNMYSLHSPYFKAVYQPESFVVRTIGYLNICQYGDAYKSLTWLEKDYRDWTVKLSSYMDGGKQSGQLYSTVRSYITGKSTDSVDGVPFQLWREMARRKDFLNMQTALNEKHDETTRYNGVNEKIKTEKAAIRFHADQSKKRFDQWKSQIAKVAKDRSLVTKVPEWQNNLEREKNLTIGYRFQLAMLEQSRQGFLEFQNQSQKKLDSETTELTAKVGQCLMRHAKNMRAEMNRVLENNEFLRYEVFSGSGENIRYQVAGGEVGNANRVPASIKPTKMMNWSFDGEFWEDEIGSYRSSLHNNCPTANTAKPVKATDEQAKLDEN